MTSMIGIKIANGEFYPILTKNTVAGKRIVLTTANDGQKSVQIDLYKNDNKSLKSAVYIGTIVVENIKDKKKGEPSIQLDIKIDKDDVISAVAVDKDVDGDGKQHTLSVSLQTIEKKDREFDIPDFDIDGDADNIIAVENIVQTGSTKKLLIIIAAILILLLASGGLWFFVFNPKAQNKALQTEVIKEQPPVPPVPSPLVEEMPVIEVPQVEPPESPPKVEPPPENTTPVIAANSSKKPQAPVLSYNVPNPIPAGGVYYKLRWGDTLWDVSQAFYKNPWLYRYLSRYNGIRNPNRILTGKTIKIPPKPR